MRINVPVYIKTGPKLTVDGSDICIKNRQGETTWSYSGKEHKGIGIAACARSGTIYMAEVLKKLGYNIGHEQMGDDGSVGYHLAVIKPDNCFHQTRHPLKQISSMLVHQSWGFMNDVIDIRGHGLLGCMEYWLKWNQLCEDFCVWQYRIEELPDIWDEFLDRIGHVKCDLPDVPINTNSSTKGRYKERTDYNNLAWSDLFNENREVAYAIVNKTKEYGYSPQGQSVATESQVTLTG